MLDMLFERKPEYDANGRLVSYSLPKILWVILAIVFFYCCKDKIMGKVMKQKGR